MTAPVASPAEEGGWLDAKRLEAAAKAYAANLSDHRRALHAAITVWDASAPSPDPIAQAVREAVEKEREKLAAFMIRNGFATGHGDTLDDLLDEFQHQISERDEVTLTATTSDLARFIESHDNFDCPEESTYVRSANAIATDIVAKYGRIRARGQRSET